MYIWDALYGKIEFSPLVYKCMLSPEVQRLREVRLCNINSLCITGSSNTNRFEHSVGTAYLAAINIEAAVQKHLKLTKKEKETFIIAALLHDVANGPFGHSYEYIMEKKGFIPEQGLGDVLGDVVSTGIGAHKNSSPFETIFFGKLRALTSILNGSQKEEVSQIIAGCHPLSKLISDSIDLDNIDNVFRMAYHMGLDFRKEAPIKLAESMFIENGSVVFLQEAKTYLEEWYLVRQRVYKFLLLNPQEFAGKYMLTEAMDILFECISQGKAEGRDIKWNYTDYQLMEELDLLKEKWLKRKTFENDAIVLLDEAEMALHPRVQKKLYDYLVEVAQQKNLTIFISTHSVTMIKSADKNHIISIEETENGKYDAVCPCYPAKAIGNVDFIDNVIYDAVFFVEDDMARTLLKRKLTGSLAGNFIIEATQRGKGAEYLCPV